jgi:hypothetical protein
MNLGELSVSTRKSGKTAAKGDRRRPEDGWKSSLTTPYYL